MYNIKIGGVRIHISVLFPAVFLYLWYYQEGTPILWWLAGMTIHECGHLLALMLCGELPSDIILSAFGVRFQLENAICATYRKDVIVAFAGPLVNILSAFVFIQTNTVLLATVHASLAIINLIPLYPLDGERILRGIMLSFFRPSVADMLLEIVYWCVWSALSVLGIVLVCPPYYNGSLLIFSLYIGISGLLHKGN